MRILISGASGFIGAPLSSYLTSKGHVVVPKSHIQEQFEGFNAVIHLAGEPLTLSRWNQEKKDKIFNSRVEGTRILCEKLNATPNPPKVFISASAIGIYGDRGEEVLDEKSAPGNGFLSHVCKEWENASAILEKRGIRTVKARFGMVLGKGGALAKIKTIYKCGLGATIGNGRGWMSWIAIEDLICAMEHALHVPILGPVNFVSPNALRQEEFSRLFAHVLHRPHFLKVPKFVLRALLGSMAEEMLFPSQHVIPSQLLESGFVFNHPDIKDVLSLNY